MLGIVTCFFNPCGYQQTVENYFRFREALGHECLTAELSFQGKFVIPDAIHLHGGPQNIMWQKERLLNIGIENLPDKYDKVAWIDADLLFLNPHWLDEAEEKLNQFPVVQLFENVHLLDSRGHVSRTIMGRVKGIETKIPGNGCLAPGGAWSARREILQDGLLDYDVTGGNDTGILDCWLGDWNSWMFRLYSPAWKSAVMNWGKKQYRKVNGNMGVIAGDVAHMFHGSLENRQYGRRTAYLIEHDFDPATDIAIDQNGLWRWDSDKPEMHRKVANYFAQRREDDTENSPLQ